MIEHSSRSELYELERKPARAERASFIICNNCFWCVSQIRLREIFSKCPTCDNPNLEVISISPGEAFLFDCDERKGVNLSFRKDVGATSNLH